MSKRFIGILIASIIFVTGSFIVAEGKKIEEPILIQLGTQHIYVNGDDPYFTLSYITNVNEDVRIEEVRIGSDTLYTQKITDFFYPFGEVENDESVMNRYTYYDLHEQQISLNAEQIQTLQTYLEKDNSVQVLFSNGLRKDYLLDVVFDEIPYRYGALSIDHDFTESEGVTTVEFTAKRDAIIEQITSEFVIGNLTLTKDNQEIALPYNATAGEKFVLEITPNIRIGKSLSYNTYIKGTFMNGEPFADQFWVDSSVILDDDWLSNYIEKVGGK